MNSNNKMALLYLGKFVFLKYSLNVGIVWWKPIEKKELTTFFLLYFIF